MTTGQADIESARAEGARSDAARSHAARSAAPLANSPDGGGRPVRVGVVGAGGMAETHLAAWQRLGVPATVFSPSGRAAHVAPRFGTTAVTELPELLSVVDVIDICSPTDTHRKLAEHAFAAGCDVICEKPLARTRADAAAIIAAARAAGRSLQVAHVVRYFGAYAAAHELAADGVLGDLRELRLRRTGATPDPAWFHDTIRSGGVLMDQMIHDFDYARWLLGEVVELSARTQQHGGNPRTVSATATLTHAGGARSYLRGGWLATGEPFTTELSIDGSAGTLHHSNLDGVLHVDSRGVQLTSAPDEDDLPYDRQLSDLLTAVIGDHRPKVTAADALSAVELTLAAIESASTGTSVNLADWRARNTDVD